MLVHNLLSLGVDKDILSNSLSSGAVDCFAYLDFIHSYMQRLQDSSPHKSYIDH